MNKGTRKSLQKNNSLASITEPIYIHLINIHEYDFISIYEKLKHTQKKFSQWFQNASRSELEDALNRWLAEPIKNDSEYTRRWQAEHELFEKLIYFKYHILEELQHEVDQLLKSKLLHNQCALNIKKDLESERSFILKDAEILKKEMRKVQNAEIIDFWENDKNKLAGMLNEGILKIGGLKGLYDYLISKEGGPKAALESLSIELNACGFPFNKRSFSALISKNNSRRKKVNKS